MLINLSIFLRPLIYLFFKGNNFTDPIDGKSYRKFLPYGYGKQRENALSPGTLSLERHRQMWLYLQNETDFFTKNYKVLQSPQKKRLDGKAPDKQALVNGSPPELLALAMDEC